MRWSGRHIVLGPNGREYVEQALMAKIALIAAAGYAGPGASPAYLTAQSGVIAVTATDDSDYLIAPGQPRTLDDLNSAPAASPPARLSATWQRTEPPVMMASMQLACRTP